MSKKKQSTCIYCGPSPTSHVMHFSNTTLSTIGSFFSIPREKPRSLLLQLERSEIAHVVSVFLVQLMVWLRIISFSDDKSKTKNSRTKSIWNEADRRGIKMQEVLVFGIRKDTQRAWLPVGADRYGANSKKNKASRKYRWHYFESIPIPPWLDQYGVTWVDDKFALKKIFTKHGLPIPRGAAVVSTSAALKILKDIGTSVITKPREGSRGRHTTVDISTPEELIKAFKRAQQLCPFVIVEEFIPGKIYRATCVGKKVVGVMELARPHIVADGVMTISELREHHNKYGKEFPELTDVQEDALFYNTILHQGYTLTSVPEKGKDVLLAEFSERVNGGYFTDLTDDVPASTIETINRAAEVCGVDINGYDIISRDLTDASERFVFIEGNTLPYIEIHDMPYAGKVINVSSAIFDLWM